MRSTDANHCQHHAGDPPRYCAAQPAAAQRRSREAKEVYRIMRQVMRENRMMAVIVRVQCARRPVVTAALGNTTTDVQATTNMSWRTARLPSPT